MNFELEEYKKKSKSLTWIILGYFYGILGIIWGIFWERIMIFLGICSLVATIFHQIWYIKRFKKKIK